MVRGSQPLAVVIDEAGDVFDPATRAERERLREISRIKDAAAQAAWEVEQETYRRTHGSDGYGLGSWKYPNNRQGRRAMARSWHGKPIGRHP